MTGIVILAAGSSSRLGQPKQLLPWRGMPLIRHMARIAIDANLGSVSVVLGAVIDPCREALENLDLTLVENENWQSGMGGSIAAGVQPLIPLHPENIIICLCDQPLVTSLDLENLAKLAKTSGSRIVASHNGKAFTPPMLFSKELFSELVSLTGSTGARELINREKSVARLDLPHAGLDIDTHEDLIRVSHMM